MNERKWLAADGDPHLMLHFLNRLSTARKVRLLIAASYRFEFDVLKPWEKRLIDVLEQLAETNEPVQNANAIDAPTPGLPDTALRLIGTTTWLGAAHAIQRFYPRSGFDLRRVKVRTTIRDIFGNPFRPVVADPRWLTSTVVALAAAFYADRAFDRLPVLADALEEAGCDHPDVLSHCRGSGPHVRGCWVVDLLLGKS